MDTVPLEIYSGAFWEVLTAGAFLPSQDFWFLLPFSLGPWFHFENLKKKSIQPIKTLCIPQKDNLRGLFLQF